MATSDIPAPGARQNGLATALHIIVAPRTALEDLRRRPTWAWAFLIACVLGAIGTVLSVPAALHSVSASMAHQIATDPHYAQLSLNQRHQMVDITLRAVRLGWAFVPFVLLISVLLQTVVLLIFNVVGRGEAAFKTLWASMMNVAIPGVGLYLFALGVIAVVRGADAYDSSTSSFLAMPSLAWLDTHGTSATIALLSTFNPFSFWTLALTVSAMLIVGRTSKANAFLAAALILVLAALVAMWGGARS